MSRPGWPARFARGGLLGLVAAFAMVWLVFGQSRPTRAADDLIVTPGAILIEAGVGDESASAVVRFESPVGRSVTLTATALIRTTYDPTVLSSAPTPHADPLTVPQSCTPGTACLGAGNVSIEPATIELTPVTPAHVTVSVSGWSRPGIYDGFIVLVPAPEASPSVAATGPAAPSSTATPAATSSSSASPEPSAVTSIPIRIVVDAPANLAFVSGSDTVTATRVQRSGPLDEFLAGWLLQPVERLDTVDLPLVNDTRDPQAVSITIDASGTRTGDGLPGSALSPQGSPPILLSPGLEPALRLDVRPNQALADVYHGTLLIQGSSEPAQVIPLELTIRPGPATPLILLIAGIALGIIAKWLLGRGSSAVAARAALDRTERSIEQLRRAGRLAETDLAFLRVRLEEVRGLVDRLDVTAGTEQLLLLNSERDLLDRLMQFQVTYRGRYGVEITKVRQAIYQLDRQAAADDFAKLRAKARDDDAAGVRLEEPVRPMPPARPPLAAPRWRSSPALLAAVITLVVAVGTILQQPLMGPNPTPTSTPSAAPSHATGEPSGAPTPAPTADGGPIAGSDTSTTILLVGLVGVVVVIGIGVLMMRSRYRPAEEEGEEELARREAGGAAAEATKPSPWTSRFSDVRFFGLRWSVLIVRAALVVGAVVAGMEVLYVNRVATDLAGSIDPVIQYVFWGIGSDALSRTLTNFAKPTG